MRFSSLPLIFLIATGCVGHSAKPTRQPIPASQERPRNRQLPALTQFNQFLIADGAVLFESWNGTRKGMDCDFRIRLKPDNQMILEVDGIGPMTFLGTYELNHEGRLKVFIPSYRNSWPIMAMKMEENVLKLYREDDVSYFGTEDHPIPGFWPFACKNRMNNRLDHNED